MRAPKSRCTSPPSALGGPGLNFQRLRRDDLPEETVDLARALIGCSLVRDHPEGRCAGRIVEVEAYVSDDPASHAFRGKTPRNAVMFEAAFYAYIYRIYGRSFCVNVTSGVRGVGTAVLIRALEPLLGEDLMQRRRPASLPRDLCRGPGRLCQALNIDLALTGVDLLGSEALWLAAAPAARASLGISRRIGISRAADLPLRFFESGSPFVSGPRSLSGISTSHA